MTRHTKEEVLEHTRKQDYGSLRDVDCGVYTVENPKYPLQDWRYEVMNCDTYLGYVEWVKHKKEAED